MRLNFFVTKCQRISLNKRSYVYQFDKTVPVNDNEKWKKKILVKSASLIPSSLSKNNNDILRKKKISQ